MGKLDGKVAVITGAASGMGAATEKLFDSEGARVLAVSYTHIRENETGRNIL